MTWARLDTAATEAGSTQIWVKAHFKELGDQREEPRNLPPKHSLGRLFSRHKGLVPSVAPESPSSAFSSLGSKEPRCPHSFSCQQPKDNITQSRASRVGTDLAGHIHYPLST